MYSKSEDNGDTWSGSYNVSQNATKRMDYPHIVSDSEGTINLTYDDDWFDPHILYKYNNGGGNWEDWSDPDTLDVDGGGNNRLVIDNNDRLYCFWYWGGPDRVFYRFRDNGNEEWSEIFNPYDSAMFINVLVGGDNSINIMGLLTTSYPHRYAFFKFQNGYWSIPEIATPLTSLNYSNMALDNQSFPHIIWHQHTPGIGFEIDSIMYRYKNQEGWSVPELVNNNYYNYRHAIAIDEFNRKYIISSADNDETYYLNEYKNINGQWEVSTIDSNNYTYYDHQLLYKDGYIYLINFQIDTIEQYSPDLSSLIFRKKEILTSLKENDDQSCQLLQNVPNPFTCTTQIRYTLEEDAFVSLIVFDLSGKKIKSLNLGSIKKGSHTLTLDSTKYPSGIYFYTLKVNGKLSNMTKMIKL